MTDPYSRDNEQETVTRSAAAEFAVRPLPLGHRLGELQLDEVLGVGGFGIVYRAFDRTLRRAVAIKEYMPSMLATRGGDYTVSLRSERFAQAFDAGRSAFLNEARLLAQFDHPGLVKVLHFWESHGTAYMVMPFFEGRTLKQLLDGGVQMGETQLRNIVAALLGALDTLHRAQCFHRDIALDNILIRPDGNPILLDFGAARKRIGDLVDDSAMMIKPGYAPIEQYTDDPAFSQGPWTDLYALGAVMHAMVAGELPPAAVVRSIKDTYRPLATRELAAREPYSPAFLAAIDHALQLRIADRPESVAAFAAELGLREFDRPPYVAPMAMPPAQTQPRQPAGDRDATAARAGVEQAAQTRQHRPDDDRDAAAAGSDAAQSAQPQQHGQRNSDAAARSGVEQTSQSQPRRQAGDGDATSAQQSGMEHAQSNRQAGDRDATFARSDAERATQSPQHRQTSDADAAPEQPGVERTSRQPQQQPASDRDVFPAQTGAGGQSPPPKPAFSPRDGMPAPESAGEHARHGQAEASEPDAPHGSDSPRARDVVGTAAIAGGGASSASAAAASSSARASTATASTAAAASAAPRSGARAAPFGDVRRRLRDRRTIAYAGGALAVLIAIGIGTAYLVKPAHEVETAATTNASAPPSPAATATPAPGSTPALVLAQREPQPALAPSPSAASAPASASADMTAHEPAPTVATTVGGEPAPQTTPQSAQPAAPQIANETGAAPSRNAPAMNIAPKGSLDATETVVANPSASGVAQPASTSIAAEAAAAAAVADSRPPDTPETIPVRFRVRPWGDIYVSGVRRGASPPLRSLSLAPGVYQIEIRNGTLPPLRRTVKIDSGSKPINIDYAFE
ncbi:serine/threonine-protein kinase [Burkholderia mayonis]|uniref:non-specific serine/threonine protein kinase n=1 Tax=Burkholderia mayonis TaxID=1385591 RepID=A0A1B4FQY7_9BURK|nr:serine/threonine-protein kinase [Burkholderia mayonis]AOJ06078.1 serine/threonine protein kinase [Burkholderia mayonis]KVE56856.1 serine/threonine protein kinase [Burkholderia mayonis]